MSHLNASEKPLTYEAVKHTAFLLMEAHPEGETTTLEVKTLLRYLGYFAAQTHVSELMDKVQKEENVEHYIDEDGGAEFRVFRLGEKEELTFKFRNN